LGLPITAIFRHVTDLPPGGGIIGCSTAYFLTRHPAYEPSKHKITLLEATEIAGGASGKAGGLLALWGESIHPGLRAGGSPLPIQLVSCLPAYPGDIVPLSYRLHADLAKEHNGAERWGYRRVDCGNLSAKARPPSIHAATDGAPRPGESVSLRGRDGTAPSRLRAAGLPSDLDWFAPECVQSYYEIGGPDVTAQVHPYQFTTSMADLAREKGVKVILGTATNVAESAGEVESVTYTDKETSESKTIPATDVIISAGPWTRSVFPSAPIAASRAHSVTIRPSRPVSAYAIFSEITLPADTGQMGESTRSRRKHHKRVTAEMYARPNNEVYACGEADALVPLPRSTAEVQTDDVRCQDIIDRVSSISDEMRDGEVLVRQACYLPSVEGAVAGPLIGQTGIKGLLLAAGHTCWGIQNGPGTGKLMSELVFDGAAKSADIRSMDPRRVI
jgi:glycine/D-amino acid oxidase-like deaminating enzyme